MNWKMIVLGLVLLDFAGLTAWTLASVGYVGFFEAAFAGPATITLFADVVIALGLFCVWMVDDARTRGATWWPYLVLTLTLGSLGPLAYLLARERHHLALRVPRTSGAPAR